MGQHSAKKIVKYLAVVIIIVLIFVFRSKLTNIFTPFIMGAVMAYIIYPITHYFENKGMTRSRSIFATYAIILAILIITFWLITPYVVTEFKTFTEELPNMEGNIRGELNILEKKLMAIPGIDNAMDKMYNRANGMITNSLKELPDRLGAVFSSLFDLILSPIVAFYILNDREKLYNNFYQLIPERNRKTAGIILDDVDKVINGYIRGQFYICLFVGIFTSAGLLAIHVKLAVLLGILTGIFNFIPYFGPIIAAIPTVLLALLDSPRKALYALIIYVAVQEVESGIISPRIIGENVGLHPLAVMFLVIFGQEFFGVWGMLLSVPVAAVIRVVLLRIAQI